MFFYYPLYSKQNFGSTFNVLMFMFYESILNLILGIRCSLQHMWVEKSFYSILLTTNIHFS